MNSRVIPLTLVALLIATTTAHAGWWPFSSKYRSVGEMEKYRFNYYADRLEGVKELKRQEAEEAARVPTPVPEPEVKIDSAQLAAPYLRPNVIETARRPTSTEASASLIREYAKLQRYDLALAEFDRIFEVNPAWKQGYLMRAGVYEQMGELGKAKAEYDLLIVDEPNWVKPRFHRAQILERLAKNDKALEDWEMLVLLAQSEGLDEMNAVAERHVAELRSR